MNAPGGGIGAILGDGAPLAATRTSGEGPHGHLPIRASFILYLRLFHKDVVRILFTKCQGVTSYRQLNRVSERSDFTYHDSRFRGKAHIKKPVANNSVTVDR